MTAVDARDREITRLQRRLRENRAQLARARAELATRPPSPDSEPEPELTAAEVEHLHAQFEPPTGRACRICGRIHGGPCQTCGGIHGRACPRVRSIQYEGHGDNIMIRKVEYWPEGQWSHDGILFADQLPPLPDEPGQGGVPSE